jgi:putative transposase
VSRYRLIPTPAQEQVMREHCAHARFVWNLAVEQQSCWRAGRASAPGYLEQSRQLTATRCEFAAVPEPVPGPGTGAVAGIDRGVAASAALSTGELLHAPRLSPGRRRRLVLLQRRLARAERGSNRRTAVKLAIARLTAREADGRKDWCEKVSTDLARRFDTIAVEDLKIADMTRSAKGTLAEPGTNVRQKAGLNREISRSGWGLLVTRLEQKAPGRVQKVNPAYTSQRCSACGHVDRDSRESQARFRCTSCGFAGHADVNAAINIAAGHAVTARGGDRVTGLVNREPQHHGLRVA